MDLKCGDMNLLGMILTLLDGLKRVKLSLREKVICASREILMKIRPRRVKLLEMMENRRSQLIGKQVVCHG